MLVVFSFCHKDADLALKQAQWIKELGQVHRHDAILACNQEARRKKLEAPIMEILTSAFNFVELYTPHDEDETQSNGGLPHARPANHLWVRVVQRIRDFKQDVPFLWMETDATPIIPEWADRIDAQFVSCRKPFLGDYVNIEGVPPHMSGIAVYHQTWRHCPDFACLSEIAWDVALARGVLPLYHKSKLIQHDWKSAPFSQPADLNRIRPEAVIYHQCKDGTLIDRLREKRVGVEAARPPHPREAAGSIPAPATPEVSELKSEIDELKEMLRNLSSPPSKTKRKGNAEGLAKARAAKAAKRQSAMV